MYLYSKNSTNLIRKVFFKYIIIQHMSLFLINFQSFAVQLLIFYKIRNFF